MKSFIAGLVVGALAVYCVMVNPSGAQKVANRAANGATAAYNAATVDSATAQK